MQLSATLNQRALGATLRMGLGPYGSGPASYRSQASLLIEYPAIILPKKIH